MHSIEVSIVYALADRQWIRELNVARGTTAGELIAASGLLEQVEELTDTDLESLQIGVYAQRVELDYLLEEGDRVEIYRPLKADPKEVRRQLAKLGKTIGKK